MNQQSTTQKKTTEPIPTELDDSEFKSYYSQTNNFSEALFDVKQCEELFQKDKSQKMIQDIDQIKQEIKISKQDEINFYRFLNLPTDVKQYCFGTSAIFPKKEKIIAWDPVQGNLIMTEDEFHKKYK